VQRVRDKRNFDMRVLIGSDSFPKAKGDSQQP